MKRFKRLLVCVLTLVMLINSVMPGYTLGAESAGEAAEPGAASAEVPAAESTSSPGTEPTLVPATEPTLVPATEPTASTESGYSLVNDGLLSQDEGNTFAQAAEEYYGENGTAAVGSLSLAWGSASQDEDVKAGQQLNLTIHWTLSPAATFVYTNQPEPLFDNFDDTAIQLTLPDDVRILEGIDGTLSNVTSIVQSGNTWTLHLTPDLPASSGQGGAITVPLLIEGNGSLPIGKTLDFSADAVQAQLATSFTIMDRTGDSDVSSGIGYTKTISGADDLGTKTTVTDDVWGISKAHSNYTVSDDKTTVTLSYTLQLGLETDAGEIITDSNQYGRVGRVPFDGNVTLTEVPAVQDRNGNPLTRKSLTVTPEFGEQQAIEVTGDQPFTLPVDTCAGKGLSGVDGSAPYYSSYTVTLVYDYDAFIAQYSDENQNPLDVTNTAEIHYTLLGGAEDADSSSVTTQVGEVTQPAAIRISKYIVDANGNAKLYTGANFPDGDPVSGTSSLSIKTEDGEDAVLYEMQENGTYKRMDGSTVSFGEPNLYGSGTVYLDPGTYTVAETAFPANTEKITGGEYNADDKTITVAAGETKDADFYNRETLGGITVAKQGHGIGSPAYLEGAVIGLYTKDDDGQLMEYARAATDASGTCGFTRLPYGTYYIREISAPEGYIQDEDTYEVTLSSASDTAEVTVVNKINLAPVKLEKYMFNGIRQVQVDSANYREFAKAFTIQYEDGEGNWVNLDGYTDLSINQQGEYTANLPVYQADGTTPITYRFMETLPEGWHDPQDPSAQWMYSDAFTLEEYLGESAGNPYIVKMENDRNGSIDLTKVLYAINASGAVEEETVREATFTLYRLLGETGSVEQVRSLTSQDGSFRFTDLERESGGTAYLYYLVEDSVSGYEADTGEGTTTIIVNSQALTAWGPFDFTAKGDEPAQLNQSLTVKNYRQQLPVTVKKVDSVTGSFVFGASFEIYRYDGDSDALGEKVIDATQINSQSGVTVYLEPGYKYIARESAVPVGYTHVTGEDDLVIDLTGHSSVDSGTDYTPVTITLKNRPDPKLLVNKRLVNGLGENSALTGVEFEIYTLNEQI